jgi:4'-phosphopantetheinyl transferase EntD
VTAAEKDVIAAVAALRAIVNSRPKTKAEFVDAFRQVTVIVNMLEAVPDKPALGAYRAPATVVRLNRPMTIEDML